MKTMIHAHRGASFYRPENTIEAFSLAIEQGADCLELDVHLSKDGEIVVAHDEHLERVSDGTGHINDYSLDELKTFNFGRLFPGNKYKIPTLSEVFTLVKPTGLSLNIELKGVTRLYHKLPGKLITLAKEHNMEDRIIYSSFNHYFLQQMKKTIPSIKIGLLYEIGLVDPWVYAKYLNADAIHPHFMIVAALPETVKHCHENNIKVNVWTADDPNVIKLMLKYNVDSIITNKPDMTFSCRQEVINEGAK